MHLGPTLFRGEVTIVRNGKKVSGVQCLHIKWSVNCPSDATIKTTYITTEVLPIVIGNSNTLNNFNGNSRKTEQTKKKKPAKIIKS